MAQGKKSFIAYSDWQDTFEALPDDKAGMLIKHIFKYVNDENPEAEDLLVNAVFQNIRNTLKRDLEKWDKQYKQRVKAGQKSAEVRKQNAATVNDRSTKSNDRSISSTVSVSVSDSVTVNDNVSDTDILLKKKQKSLSKLVLKDFPYRSKEFLATWKMWLEERKAMRKDYKTERSEKMALAKLIKETENERHAIETIEFAIASGHQGLYPKKERKSPDNRTNKERVADIMGVSRPKSTHNGSANSEGSVTIDADFKVQDD